MFKLEKICVHCLVKVMSFEEFCVWLARPIYSIQTRKLCSQKGN